MPIPLVLTRIGATQSASIQMGSFAASRPVVDHGHRA
jgi:hypothetical protein